MVIIIAAFALAQLVGGSSSITGMVTDPSGARVPNAKVTAINEDTRERETVVSRSDGSYVFSNIPAGRYSLVFRVPGFAVFHADDLTVDGGLETHANANLNLGRIAESIQVTARGTPHAQVAQGTAPKPIRIGGNVMAANVLSMVKPTYPADLQAQGLEGTVSLQAVIAKDGTPQSVRAQSSQVNAEFVTAAVEAVKQWRYKPTLLNGEPVEVITSIDVNFALSPQ